MRGRVLFFNSHFDRDTGLDYGRFSLGSLSEGTKEIWVAASSYGTKQFPESFHYRGGFLPPEYRVPGLKNWWFKTSPISMPHVKGVAGNFYQILPFQVHTDKGGVRGDFGIHLDANAPGSLGCIVMSKDRFTQFESWMTKLRSSGVERVPLFVRYS